MPGSRACARSSAHALARQVDRRERAERAVVDDIGIGDRQDHARALGAEPAIEQVLQEDDVGTGVELGLGVHAVVRRQHDHCAHRIERAR